MKPILTSEDAKRNAKMAAVRISEALALMDKVWAKEEPARKLIVKAMRLARIAKDVMHGLNGEDIGLEKEGEK